MADTKASEAGRDLVRQRWGNQVVTRAAAVVIERRDELPAALRAELVGALTERKDVPGE
jgi:hypothetical protein